MVTLERMSADAWERWMSSAIRGYAADKVRVGTWLREDAEAKSAAEFAVLLPDGQATPGHEFRSIIDETGASVGGLWFAPLRESGRDEAFRGRGYGRAALVALEPIVLELGYDTIGLHVFGDNDVARNLYRTSGYLESDVMMRKRLR